jgi:hypothetical protein
MDLADEEHAFLVDRGIAQRPGLRVYFVEILSICRVTYSPLGSHSHSSDEEISSITRLTFVLSRREEASEAALRSGRLVTATYIGRSQ